MRRPLGYGSLGLAALAFVTAAVIRESDLLSSGSVISGVSVAVIVNRVLLVVGILLAAYGLYLLLMGVVARTATKRRYHDLRNVFRFVFGAAGATAALGIVTEQWIGVLFSLGVVGFGITFALQQPILSFLGWVYIMAKRPYSVGDRVRIGESKGDVIEVDFLVTTLWEINGELVTSNQPSGRVVTLPNSSVLSQQVVNFGGAGFPYVWNELAVQVAYETDLTFARDEMIEIADEYLGDEMAEAVENYRDALAETAVELEVADRPTVNVVQNESWVELKLRYLVHPRRATRTRNVLLERILRRFTDDPDRVKFPVGRNR